MPDFTSADVKGRYSFQLSGDQAGLSLQYVGPMAVGGIFSADGSGNITSGLIEVRNSNISVEAKPLITGSGNSSYVIKDRSGYVVLKFVYNDGFNRRVEITVAMFFIPGR